MQDVCRTMHVTAPGQSLESHRESYARNGEQVANLH